MTILESDKPPATVWDSHPRLIREVTKIFCIRHSSMTILESDSQVLLLDSKLEQPDSEARVKTDITSSMTTYCGAT